MAINESGRESYQFSIKSSQFSWDWGRQTWVRNIYNKMNSEEFYTLQPKPI